MEKSNPRILPASLPDNSAKVMWLEAYISVQISLGFHW